ncbi:hypothetical protein [Marinobacter sp. OP 3.4]|uniref:hypothetical protein n=1 Tax=Marinobacter sp. OP 3.4 TaxID=3076501 RepID=UPI002E2191A5
MMQQTLDELIATRRALLASDDASLEQLRQVDRRLLTRAERGDAASPLPDNLTEGSLLPLASLPVDEATLWLEVAVSIGGVQVRPALDALAKEPGGESLSWWLAANYPGLSVTREFPEAPELQVLAARAHWRRGQNDKLPQPWKEWAAVVDGHKELSRPLVETLWDILPADARVEGFASWKDWFYPLMVGAHDDWQLWMVNWLLAEVDTTTTVEAMGVSCARRFLSWLEAIGAGTGLDGNEDVADAAERELRWLMGDRRGRQQEPSPFGYQCWGEILRDGHGLKPASWQKRFTALPMGFRERCWYWSGQQINGSPWSLFGGQWCVGD